MSQNQLLDEELIIGEYFQNEKGDTLFYFDKDTYLERKKTIDGEIVTLYKDGKSLNLDEATTSDLPYLYIEQYLGDVVNESKLEIDHTLFLKDEELLKKTRVQLLTLLDLLSYTHCENCPISVTKDSKTTMAYYCNTVCPVGLEHQFVGAIMEKQKRPRLDRGRRTQEVNPIIEKKRKTKALEVVTLDSIEDVREEIKERQLSGIKKLYLRLVNPKKVFKEAEED